MYYLYELYYAITGASLRTKDLGKKKVKKANPLIRCSINHFCIIWLLFSSSEGKPQKINTSFNRAHLFYSYFEKESTTKSRTQS